MRGARECWQSPEAGRLAPGTGGSDLGRFEPRPRPEALTAPKRHAVRGPASATRFPGHSDARLAPATLATPCSRPHSSSGRRKNVQTHGDVRRDFT